jgi:hypothetical protein
VSLQLDETILAPKLELVTTFPSFSVDGSLVHRLRSLGLRIIEQGFSANAM